MTKAIDRVWLFAVLCQSAKVSKDDQNKGGAGIVNVWNIHVEPGEFSKASIFVGRRDNFDLIDAGWIVISLSLSLSLSLSPFVLSSSKIIDGNVLSLLLSHKSRSTVIWTLLWWMVRQHTFEKKKEKKKKISRWEV